MKMTTSKQGLKTISLIRKISKVLQEANFSDDMYKQGHKQGFIEGWKARIEAEKKEKIVNEYIEHNGKGEA